MIDGAELYEIHYDAMAECASVSIEKWEDLSENERLAWDTLAEQASSTVEERLREE